MLNMLIKILIRILIRVWITANVFIGKDYYLFKDNYNEIQLYIFYYITLILSIFFIVEYNFYHLLF